jgi:hypothetical protein
MLLTKEGILQDLKAKVPAGFRLQLRQNMHLGRQKQLRVTRAATRIYAHCAFLLDIAQATGYAATNCQLYNVGHCFCTSVIPISSRASAHFLT